MGRGSAKKIEYKGIVFDSNAEYLFYLELLEKEKQGKVRDIGVHVPFELIPKFKTKSGSNIRKMDYVADFVYYDKVLKRFRVVDIKGFEEDHFKIKKKVFEYKYCRKDDDAFNELEVLKYTKKTGFIPIKEYKKMLSAKKKDKKAKK